MISVKSEDEVDAVMADAISEALRAAEKRRSRAGELLLRTSIYSISLRSVCLCTFRLVI